MRAIMAGVCLAFTAAVSSGSTGTSLTILHLNDTHSTLLPWMMRITLPPDSSNWGLPVGCVARIAAVVDSIRGEEENVIFLHAGDMVQGTLFYTLFGGEADAAVYNAMELDAMVPGNHEFDRGSEGVLVLLEAAEFPIVCANIDAEGDSLLAGRLPPFVILETVAGRVAVIGLVTGDLSKVSSPSDATLVLPVAETARRYAESASEQGADIVVLLTHIGYHKDVALASEVPGVDLIVGGHSHTLLGDFQRIGLAAEGPYPALVTGPDGGEVTVVTAGSRAAVLGRITLELDSLGRVTGHSGGPLIVTGGEYQDASRTPVGPEARDHLEGLLSAEPLVAVAGENPDVAELVGAFEAELASFAWEVAGSASADLLHRRVPDGELPGGSMIAPVICDAMLRKMEKVGLEPDFALLNAGGARISIPAGDITVGTVFTLLPFGNTLAVMDLTGAEVRSALEDGLANIFDEDGSDGSFPYTAGLRYDADAGMPRGSRVTSLEIHSPEGWAPLDPGRVYRMVTVAFLAAGGDGYDTLRGIDCLDTGFIDAEVFLEYLGEKGIIDPPSEPSVRFTPCIAD